MFIPTVQQLLRHRETWHWKSLLHSLNNRFYFLPIFYLNVGELLSAELMFTFGRLFLLSRTVNV